MLELSYVFPSPPRFGGLVTAVRGWFEDRVRFGCVRMVHLQQWLSTIEVSIQPYYLVVSNKGRSYRRAFGPKFLYFPLFFFRAFFFISRFSFFFPKYWNATWTFQIFCPLFDFQSFEIFPCFSLCILLFLGELKKKENLGKNVDKNDPT